MSRNVADPYILVLDCSKTQLSLYMAGGVLGFVLNSTFLFVLARNKDLFKRKRITYQVANLALADTSAGISLFLFTIKSCIVHVDFNRFWYMIHGAMFLSFMAVLFMAIERIVVINWPFTWKEILTLKRMFVAIFITWITAVILVIMPPFTINSKYTKTKLFFSMFVFVGIAILIANSIIAFLLWYNKRKLAASAVTQQTTNCSKEKALKLVIMINIILAVTCLPIAVYELIDEICDHFSLSNCNIIGFSIYPYLRILAYTNFLVNPIIYVWRDNAYRKAFCSMFKASTRINGRATPV